METFLMNAPRIAFFTAVFTACIAAIIIIINVMVYRIGGFSALSLFIIGQIIAGWFFILRFGHFF